jgi:hypothetical protein
MRAGRRWHRGKRRGVVSGRDACLSNSASLAASSSGKSKPLTTSTISSMTFPLSACVLASSSPSPFSTVCIVDQTGSSFQVDDWGPTGAGPHHQLTSDFAPRVLQ